MKFNMLLGLIVTSVYICGTGCSEPDSWAGRPKDCEATVVAEKTREPKAVPCSGPVAAGTIVNESRSAHEARFGGPYLKMIEKDTPNQVFYNGGSIMWYETADPEVAFYMEIYPENLDFNPQAILGFLSITDMPVQAQPAGSPIYEYIWPSNSKYATVTADSWVDKKPDKVYRIKLYGPNRRQ